MDGDSDFSENLYLRKSVHFAIDRQKMLKYLRNNVGTSRKSWIYTCWSTYFF